MQLALVGGAWVTAQVSGPQRQAEAQALGAHAVCITVDATCGPFDLVLDGSGGSMLRDSLHRMARAVRRSPTGHWRDQRSWECETLPAMVG